MSRRPSVDGLRSKYTFLIPAATPWMSPALQGRKGIFRKRAPPTATSEASACSRRGHQERALWRSALREPRRVPVVSAGGRGGVAAALSEVL